jgi:hypothetical protein
MQRRFEGYTASFPNLDHYLALVDRILIFFTPDASTIYKVPCWKFIGALKMSQVLDHWFLFLLFTPPLPEGGGGYTVLPLSVQDIFRHIFLSNCWWQKSDIWSQASYRYPISWEAFLDPSDSYFLFADFVDFYTHWTYILYKPIFSRIFLSNYWWQKSDIWSHASYR